jgi:hypothetical protein
MSYHEKRPDIAFYSFLSELEVTSTQPLDLPPEEKEVFTTLVTSSLLPQMRNLGEEVRKKGTSAPPKADWNSDYKPVLYTYNFIDRGPNGEDWFGTTIHTPVEQESLVVQGELLGIVDSRFYVSNHVNVVSFCFLDNDVITCENADVADSERVLDTTPSIFDPLPSMVLYPVGNPAIWLARLVTHGSLPNMEAGLATLPALR